MLRVVERVLGEGDLVREGQTLLRAGYEIALYRHWADENGTLVPGTYTVEGCLLAAPGDLDRALGTSSPATLLMDDGRRVDLYVLNPEGAITAADDRGFY
jgi:hypothetical protein